MKLFLGDDEVVEWHSAPLVFYRPLLVNVYERVRTNPLDGLEVGVRYKFVRQEPRDD